MTLDDEIHKLDYPQDSYRLWCPGVQPVKTPHWYASQTKPYRTSTKTCDNCMDAYTKTQEGQQ